MKIKKILLIIMIIAIIFPSIATTLSYAKDDIISKQEENEQENLQEEGKNENNQVLENNNVEIGNSAEDSNIIDIDNKVDEDMSTNNNDKESIKKENELLEHTINTEENEVEQPTIQSNEKSIPVGIEIEEGTYYIHTKTNEKQVLDIAGQSTANSANVKCSNMGEIRRKNKKSNV